MLLPHSHSFNSFSYFRENVCSRELRDFDLLNAFHKLAFYHTRTFPFYIYSLCFCVIPCMYGTLCFGDRLILSTFSTLRYMCDIRTHTHTYTHAFPHIFEVWSTKKLTSFVDQNKIFILKTHTNAYLRCILIGEKYLWKKMWEKSDDHRYYTSLITNRLYVWRHKIKLLS